MERVTLAALLGGLQSGVSGDQAMPLLSAMLQQRQSRMSANQDFRQQMMQQQMSALQGIAGSAASDDAGNAYLQSLIDANYIKPKMADRLTDFNSALYPGGGQSPLYGITGTPAPTAMTAPEIPPITGIPDSELRAYFNEGSGNSALRIAILTALREGGAETPSEIYDYIARIPDNTGYFAQMNREATATAINAVLKNLGMLPEPEAPDNYAAPSPGFNSQYLPPSPGYGTGWSPSSGNGVGYSFSN